MLDLQVSASEILEEKERKFSHDRSLTVGASEIGVCARRVWFEKKLGKAGWDDDYKPAWGAAQRGDILEEQWTVPIVRKAIEKVGGKLIWAGAGQQHTIEVRNWNMSATPDGLGIELPKNFLEKYGVTDLLGTTCVIELKSFDPRIGKWALPKSEHIDQLIAQMGLIRKEGTYEPRWGIIVYVNASFLDDIRIYPVFFNRLQFEGQIRRAIAIMQATDADQLRPEGVIAGRKECEYCPFKARCAGYTKSVPKANLGMADIPGHQRNMLRAAVTRWHNVRRELIDLVAREDGAKAMIKEAMSRAGTRTFSGKTMGYGRDDCHPFDVTWRVTKPRVTWKDDKIKELIEESGKSVEDFQKTGKPGDMLLIKVREEEHGEKKFSRTDDKTDNLIKDDDREIDEADVTTKLRFFK